MLIKEELKVAMKLFLLLSAVVIVVKSNPVVRNGYASPRNPRSIDDELTPDFIQQMKVLTRIRSHCKAEEFLDLDLQTCKDCEIYCPNNTCLLCQAYYDVKEAEEKAQYNADKNDEMKSYYNDIDIGQWCFIAVLTVAVLVIAVCTVYLFVTKREDKAPYVTLDGSPHDRRKNSIPRQPVGETFTGMVKANKEVADENNRRDDESATRPKPPQVTQPENP